ncbi:MAG: hypothetical protein P8J89_03950 [Phycisphaerales bacterium]|nr:hypothetical protein [Phycisphaerales bacterium]
MMKGIVAPKRSFDWSRDGWWVLVSIALLVVLSFFFRWSSSVMEKGPTWDERYILVPIIDLVQQGWSVETAIDFQEAKGPAMIWPYAIWAEVFGDSINTLRLLSLICLLLTCLPLMWLALRCGLSPPALPLVSLGLFLLPFEALLAQLVMGEPSYVLGVALMLAVVIWGSARSDDDPIGSERRFLGPFWYAIILIVLLHSRIHVVPITGGICLALFCRDGFRSWPWWLASIIAGLLRIPLWIRWGGLVSSDYQGMHGLGLRLESLTYFGAAFAILFGIFLLVWLARYRHLVFWWWAPAGVGLGFLMGYMVPPDLIDPHSWEAINVKSISLFLGPTRSLAVGLAPDEALQWLPISILCAIGLGGLGSFGAMAFQYRSSETIATVARIQFITMLCAWGLYLFTHGFVFDRFILAWTALMPILWVAMLPRWAWFIQAMALVAYLWLLASSWLW